jgi:hypothetical protein
VSTAVPLADLVLPLIRSRSRDLWRYTVSNEHGERMHDVIDILETALDRPNLIASQYGGTEPSPHEVYQVTHRALASAIRVIARADDSAGIIGDACRRLIDLHPRAAARADVPPLKLADWMFDFHFDDEVDYFELDPVAYAPALGDRGLARLHKRVETLRREFDDARAHGTARAFDHREHLLTWFDQRFAVLDRDVEAIIRTHLRDGRVAAWFEDVAEAFEEIGRDDLAIEWAERATLFDHGHQSRRAAELWWRLLATHRPADLSDAAHTIFDRWPSASTGERLVETFGLDAVDEVQAALEPQPRELVRFQLETLRDVSAAWESAHQLGLTDPQLWGQLAKAYTSIDPKAAIRVQLQLVAASLEVADTRKYRPAARDLSKIRVSALSVGLEVLAEVDEVLADLRDRYRRRPSLLAALDRAKLP